jgi:enoyl-[acyl-carrier protein] reductase II
VGKIHSVVPAAERVAELVLGLPVTTNPVHPWSLVEPELRMHS